jgi:hypothetical protein
MEITLSTAAIGHNKQTANSNDIKIKKEIK